MTDRFLCPLKNFAECVYERCGFWYWDVNDDNGCSVKIIARKMKEGDK